MRIAQMIPAFSNGELSPKVLARVDIEQRRRSAKELTNFLVRPYGNIENATGLLFVNEVKDSSKEVRLLPFVFSTTQAYVLEFGDNYVRYFTDGGMVYSGSTILETATPYNDNELKDIRIAQNGDVLYIVHPLYAPRKLVRNSATSWTLSEISFVKTPFKDENTTDTTLTPSGTSGTITVTASASVFESGHIGSVWQHISGSTTGRFKITAVASGTSATATVIDTVAASASAKWSESAWSGVAGYPETIAFHQNRLFLCGTKTEPKRGWCSDILVYDSFNIDSTDDDTGFDFDLPGNEYNKILWVLSGENLSIGTSGAEFVLSSGNSPTLTPTNRNCKQQTAYGAENGIALSFGAYQYFIQRSGRKLMELAYKWEENQYTSTDMTVLSEHITKSGIKEFSLRKNQDAVMYCVLNNGEIVAFTREITQNVIAWSRLTTDGLFKSVCAIPRATGNDDVVCVVERTIDGNTKKYIEYFSQRSEYIVDSNFLDSSLVYDGYSLTSGITLTASAKTGDITLTTSGAYFTSGMEGRTLKVIDDEYNLIGKCKITAYISATEVDATVIRALPDTTISGETWAVGVTTISGLDHLEGKEVHTLLDGAYNNTALTVASGSITLPNNYCYVVVGLLKESVLKTMPIYEGSQLGTAVGKKSRIPLVDIIVNNTSGITIGSDKFQSDVFERNASTMLGEPEALKTEIKRVAINNEWSNEAYVTIKQSTPLPCDILGLVLHTDTEEI